MPDTSPNFSPLLTREEIIAREAKRRQILQRLDAKRPTTRLEAIEECKRLSPDEIGMLVTLSERADEWRFPLWFKVLGNVVVAVGALGSIVGAVYGNTHPGFALGTHPFEYIACCLALAIASLFVNGKHYTNRYSLRVKASLQQMVVESQNPDIFPLLMRMTRSYQNEQSSPEKVLYEAASRWMLTLSTEQIRAYAVRHQALYVFLFPIRAWENPELTLRVLRLLEEIGTTNAIPVVKILAQDIAPGKKYKTIRNAARACLGVLEERERQSRMPEILLRASSAPVVETEILLRGASAPPPAPDTLLRPLTTQAVAAAPEQLLRSSYVEE